MFYIIISGNCQVKIDGNAIAQLGELDIFGENSLFTDGNVKSIREATVTTMIDNENVRLLSLPRLKFNKLLSSGTLNEDCMDRIKRVAEKRKKENKTLEQKTFVE